MEAGQYATYDAVPEVCREGLCFGSKLPPEAPHKELGGGRGTVGEEVGDQELLFGLDREDDGVADHQSDEGLGHLLAPLEVGEGAELRVADGDSFGVLQGVVEHPEHGGKEPLGPNKVVLVQPMVGIRVVEE